MKVSTLWLALAGLLLGVGTASAQGKGDDGSTAAERARIAAERADVERHYQSQVRACQQRFVVTSCLDEAKAQRRVRTEDLQQQSRLLDADQRKRDASVVIKRVEKKLAEEQDRVSPPRPAASARAAAPAAAASASARVREEKTPSAKSEQQEKARQLAYEDRQRRQQEASQRRAASAQAAASKTKAYEERQQEAQRQRIAHEQKLKERSKPRADSLPPG